ncbi:unnamed protein product [Miscanthus lutarioriparius]|uniref:Uncharacterized protein n=1 Tax=Miscanthus lutarioriparius TaxID=422564 RepID=A0A811P0J7_9POAL|nr:unnamed protein product [Miscanthus lutarioriparius]
MPTEPRQRAATIREQLSALDNGKVVDEFTLPLGKKLKEGLKSLNKLTVSQRRNNKRQALLTQVSGRNDSLFFATVGAFVLVPPFAILAIAVITGKTTILKILGGKHMVDPSMVRVLGRSTFHDTVLTSSSDLSAISAVRCR